MINPPAVLLVLTKLFNPKITKLFIENANISPLIENRNLDNTNILDHIKEKIYFQFPDLLNYGILKGNPLNKIGMTIFTFKMI